MAKERIEIKNPVAVKANQVDSNDVLYRNIQIAKLRMAFPLEKGTVGITGSFELAYKNDTRQNMLMRIELSPNLGFIAELRYSKNNSSSQPIIMKGLLINLVAYYAEEAFVLLLPGEEIWIQAIQGNAFWRIVSLNNLL